MSNYLIKAEEKITNKVGRIIERENYKLLCKIWKTQEERMSGSVEKHYITDQSFTMAIKNPRYTYCNGGAMELWAVGERNILLYHEDNKSSGLFKPALKMMKIIKEPYSTRFSYTEKAS